MARTRNPKSTNSFGGIGFPPEVEIAAKRYIADKELGSLKALIRFAVKKHLKEEKYLLQ